MAGRGIYYLLEYTCNKCCNLIGHSEVSISHRDLQVFHRDPQRWHTTNVISGRLPTEATLASPALNKPVN